MNFHFQILVEGGQAIAKPPGINHFIGGKPRGNADASRRRSLNGVRF
jgi:hypothetical protein